jgi:acetyl esterase/lipase
VPLPAGVACISPWLDLTQSDPQWDEASPTPFDYLPKPAAIRRAAIPPCDAWPANPPRTYLYASDDLIAHPLSSLVMAPTWKGAPPIYLNTGWEILSPEDLWLARKLVDEGVTVVLEEYEAMPHVFPMILQKTPNARRCFQGWASFISTVTSQEDIQSNAVTIRAKTLEEVPLRFHDLQTVSETEMRERVAFKLSLDLKMKL